MCGEARSRAVDFVNASDGSGRASCHRLGLCAGCRRLWTEAIVDRGTARPAIANTFLEGRKMLILQSQKGL